ncbi:hypothetical protein EV147_3869 [Cupriavidus agavae]|uniref:Uncharacterized protein n=1 Tax=Cupriavidus agavae TaxID=1001822 RepID=A0A4Q7RP67_9BURK|nr:hypothetical protein EV147_3869 [Cupriavidus agavae]
MHESGLSPFWRSENGFSFKKMNGAVLGGVCRTGARLTFKLESQSMSGHWLQEGRGADNLRRAIPRSREASKIGLRSGSEHAKLHSQFRQLSGKIGHNIHTCRASDAAFAVATIGAAACSVIRRGTFCRGGSNLGTPAGANTPMPAQSWRAWYGSGPDATNDGRFALECTGRLYGAGSRTEVSRLRCKLRGSTVNFPIRLRGGRIV